MSLLREKTACALGLLVVGACASGEVIQASSGNLDGGAGVSGTSASAGSGGDSGSSATGGASSGGSAGNGSAGSGGSWPSDGGGTGGDSGGWPTGGSGGGDGSSGSGGNATGGTGAGPSGGTGGGGTTGGSGGTSGCTPPLVDCNGTCVDTATDPQHCNACSNACAAPNSTASCAGGVCNYTCNAGFVKVGSKCATFGGAFAGPGPGCGAAGCYTGNLSAGCACPANFAPIGPIDMLDDRACPNNNPPFGWQSAYVCIGGAWSTSADFGGAYHRQGTTCVDGNPFNANACSCPAPSVAIEMIADGGCWNDTQVGMCWNPSVTLSTFGGAYQKSDHTAYGSAGCVTGNPATGGACSCPAGTTAISIRNIFGPGNAGCQANGAYGSHIYICHAL